MKCSNETMLSSRCMSRYISRPS